MSDVVPGNVIISDGPELWGREGARLVVRLIQSRIDQSGRCSLVLAGGSTPRRLYEELAALDLPWARVVFYFGDERMVPPDHNQSNYGMALESLLKPLGIPDSHVIRIRGESPHEVAADDYDLLFPEKPDLLLLGMGADGHTASLFPGHQGLAETRRRIIAVETDAEPARRVSITPRIVKQAEEVVMLATGEAKAEPVALALRAEGEIESVPARLARHGTWILDPAAASRLKDD